MIEKELVPIWGGRHLRDVERADVLLLLERIRVDRKSAVMAERVGTLVSTIFNFAVARALVSENPAARLEKAAVEPVQTRGPMTAEDIRAVWTAAERESPVSRACIRFLFLTGQKTSDVLTLRWSDIELESWKLRSAKRGERTLPLSPQALQLLRDLRPSSGAEFVFSGHGRAGHLAQVRAAMNRICSQVGITPAWTTRDIRRTVEQALRGLRVRPDVIEAFLGRTSSRIPFRPGTDYDYQNDLRAAAGLWGKKIHEYTRPTKKQPSGAKIIPLFPG